MLSRKKRRGIIEKRRRDRINTSLLELRRLVPSAFEKQGSAKLEKAEILQMTVDHLKTLHSKGGDNLGYDPSKLAMDYHSIGFRECAAEVARYLVTVEGLDLQDPLRLRLMSHLQCFAAQRDLASKQTWSGYPPPPPPGPGPPPHHYPPTPHDTSGSSNNNSFESSGGEGTPSVSTASPPAALAAPAYQTHPAPGYPPHAYHPPNPHHQGYHSPVSSQKPYRPWGAELAY